MTSRRGTVRNGVPYIFMRSLATRRAHLATAIGLFAGSWLSGYFIIATNAFMQHPVGHSVQPDGSLRNRRNFAKYATVTPNAAGVPVSGADGLTIDSQGRLYAACADGVEVFSPRGQHLGTIPMPRPPQNLSFAGADKKTLYVVGRGVASKVQMIAAGIKERPR